MMMMMMSVIVMMGDDNDNDDDDEYSSDDVGKKFYISRVNRIYQVQTFGSNRSLRVIDV